MTIQEKLRIYWTTTSEEIREEVRERAKVEYHDEYRV